MMFSLVFLLVFFEKCFQVKGLPTSRQPRSVASQYVISSSATANTHCVLSCNQAGQVVQICNGCQMLNVSINEYFCSITKACSRPRPCVGSYLKEQQKLWRFSGRNAHRSCVDKRMDAEGITTFTAISGEVAGKTMKMSSCTLPGRPRQERVQHGAELLTWLKVKAKHSGNATSRKWRERKCVCFNGRWMKLHWFKRLTSSTKKSRRAAKKLEKLGVEKAFCSFRNGLKIYEIVQKSKTGLWTHPV